MINIYQRERHLDTYIGDASFAWFADELQRTQQSSESLVVLCIGIRPTAQTTLSAGAWEAALQQATLRIRTTIRIRDRIFARQGDEIMVVLPHTNIEGTITLINRLIRRLTEQPMINVPDMAITTHIGGAASTAHSNADAMLQLAQTRMHAACGLQRHFIFADEPQSGHELLPRIVNPQYAFVREIAQWVQARTAALQSHRDPAQTQNALHEIDARWNDIQQALTWIVSNNMVDAGLHMVLPIAQYCLIQNRIADGVKFVEDVTGVAGLSTADIYIQAMIALGELLLRAGDLASAADRLHIAFTLATLPHIQQPDLAALALSCMGLMYLQQNQSTLALAYAQKAQELALNSGKPQVIVLVRTRLLQIQAG